MSCILARREREREREREFIYLVFYSADGTGDANQPPSEGTTQTDGDEIAATDDGGLGQRQQGDGQSTANLQQQAAAVGGASQAPPTTTTTTTTSGNQTTGDSSQQPAPGAVGGFMPPPFPPPHSFMPHPAFFPSLPPFGFMGPPPPMGGECQKLSLFFFFFENAAYPKQRWYIKGVAL